jgi:hypothetical protein
MSLNTATVRLVSGSNITATVNTSGGQIQASAPVTLRTTPSRLDQLDDVIENSPVDGSVLVYRASDDKYIVQQLSLNNLGGNLDGGDF